MNGLRGLVALLRARCTCGYTYGDRKAILDGAGFWTALGLIALGVFVGGTAPSFARWSRSVTASGTVIDARIGPRPEPPGKTRYLGEVLVRYERAGRTVEDWVEEQAPFAHKRVEGPRRFLDGLPVGSQVLVYVDSAGGGEALLAPRPPGMWLALLVFALLAFTAAVDALCPALQRRLAHLQRHRDGRWLVPNFDDWDVLVQPRFFGPNLGRSSWLLILLVITSCLWGSFSPAWIAAAVAAGALAVVSSVRLGRILGVWQRWRDARLEPASGSFAPGAELRFRLVAGPLLPRLSAQLLQLEETLRKDGVWRGRTLGVMPVAIEGPAVHGGVVLRTELPEDADAPSWRPFERVRWTLRLRAQDRGAHFDVDVEPDAPPSLDPPHLAKLAEAGAWLREIRGLAGEAPRRLRGIPPSQLWGERPKWMTDDDELLETYERQRAMLREGRIVWGHLVQANRLLFSPGEDDCPADVVYAVDPSFDQDLEGLAAIARRLSATKQRPQAWVSHVLAGESQRVARYRLPSWLSGSRDVYFGSIMLHRRLLPDGVLTAFVVPLLVDPRQPSLPIVVPAALWGDGLRSFWSTQVDEDDEDDEDDEEDDAADEDDEQEPSTPRR